MVGQPNRRGWGRIRKLPSKRWQANYVGPDLARHNAPHTFTAKMDAERWLSDERRSIERDEWTPPAARGAVAKAKGVSLGEYASTWLAQRRLKHRTKAHYEALIRNHITPRLGAVALRNLTPAAVRSWYAALNPDHRIANSHAYSLLHGICATAVGDGLLTDNPCQIKRAMNTPRQRQPVILTVAEMAALADAIEPQRLRALVIISAWCGLRWGEVIELRRKDVSVDASVLSVGPWGHPPGRLPHRHPQVGQAPNGGGAPTHSGGIHAPPGCVHRPRRRGPVVRAGPRGMSPQRPSVPRLPGTGAEKHWARRGQGA